LTVVQAVMLDSMRLWVMEMRRGVSMETRVTERLGQVGAAAAAPDLKRFMFALSAGCTRMIEVRCTCRPDIDLDEEALLDVLTLAQELSRVAALQILRRFLTEEGAHTALDAAEGVGEVLSQAGCFLQASDQSGREGSMVIAFDDLTAAHMTLH
jgi:hypothetical protein